MGFVIDSNVIIAAERSRSGLELLLGDALDSECFLSVITVSELLHGIARAASVTQLRRRLQFLEPILDRFEILPIDEATARLHATLWADLLSTGTMIGIHDLWIAASCLRYGHALVSDNRREFARISALEIRTLS